MFIAADTFDDLLRCVITEVLEKGHRVKPTRGKTTELFGVLLQLNNPRARLSRTEAKRALFSCLGEFLWYLSKKNALPFIAYYAKQYRKESEDGKTVRSGYGPRLFSNRGHNQIANVITTLKSKRNSRRAVIQIFEASDAVRRKEAPCTCTLQFVIRSGALHMITFMRSNDIYLGLPHDVFAFTMLQEVIAQTLGVKLGKYTHAVGSLHLYDKHRKAAQKLLNEGWQDIIPMPHMPKSDPWPALKQLLRVEARLREKKKIDIEELSLDPYWKDLARLLQVYRFYRNKDYAEIGTVKELMSVDVYHPLIEHKQKRRAKKRKPPSSRQRNRRLSRRSAPQDKDAAPYPNSR